MVNTPLISPSSFIYRWFSQSNPHFSCFTSIFFGSTWFNPPWFLSFRPQVIGRRLSGTASTVAVEVPELPELPPRMPPQLPFHFRLDVGATGIPWLFSHEFWWEQIIIYCSWCNWCNHETWRMMLGGSTWVSEPHDFGAPFQVST